MRVENLYLTEAGPNADVKKYLDKGLNNLSDSPRLKGKNPVVISQSDYDTEVKNFATRIQKTGSLLTQDQWLDEADKIMDKYRQDPGDTNTDQNQTDAVDLRQAFYDLAKGKSEPFLNALKSIGHLETATLLSKLKLATISNFAKSVGLTDLSAWKMPFLNMLDKKDTLNVLTTDSIFTDAYNLLYRMKPAPWVNDYMNNSNAIIFTQDFYRYITNTEEAIKLMKYDSTIVSDPEKSKLLKDAIKHGDYGKLISDSNTEDELDSDDKKFFDDFLKYIKNASQDTIDQLIKTLEKSKK